MNQKGYGYAGFGSTQTRPIPIVGEENPFTAHEKQVARDRLKNNHSKMLGQLGVKNTTERSQRYTNGASLSMSKQNGVFPNDAYQYPPGGLRGGMARTCSTGGFEMGGGAMVGGTQKYFYFAEGQKWLENWKNRRIAELNAIQKDDFSAGRPQRIPVAPEYDALDAILAKVLDQFEAGAFSSGLLDDMNKLQGAFLKMGDSITSQKLAQYMRVVGDIRKQVQRITADPEPTVQQLDQGDEVEEVVEDARRGQPARQYRGNTFKLDNKDLKVIRATGLIADRLVRLLEEINRVINESPEVRKRAIEEIGSRVLGAISRQQSAFGQPSTQPRKVVPTIGQMSERGTRIPEERPPAELEAPPAGMPPVKPF
jgi:hypothetical protein